jgi:hypothetical protein
MELDEVMDPTVGAAIATVAVVASKPARRLLHHGVVLGVTGVLFVTDAVAALGRGVVRGVRGSDGNGGDGNGAPAKRARRRVQRAKTGEE